MTTTQAFIISIPIAIIVFLPMWREIKKTPWERVITNE